VAFAVAEEMRDLGMATTLLAHLAEKRSRPGLAGSRPRCCRRTTG
jgi:hypothetical protein